MPVKSLYLVQDENGLPVGHYWARDAAVTALRDWINELPESVYHLSGDDAEEVTNRMLAVYLKALLEWTR